MAEIETSEFQNMRGGITRQYSTDTASPLILAYVDFVGEHRAEVTVFDPSNGHSRAYTERDTDKCLAIVTRHLVKLGYNPL